MISIKNIILNSNWFQKLIYSQNWNIGFPQTTIEKVVRGEGYKTVWMKHSYHDRFFADPFIYKVTSDEIIILAEELIFKENKGRIVRLVVDKNDYHLLNRQIILEKNTHLSYPAILRIGEKFYIYPENGASGNLTLYEYNDADCSAVEVNILLEKPVADATIFSKGDDYLMLATDSAMHDTNCSLYICSNPLKAKFEEIDGIVYAEKNGARSAGAIIQIDNDLYRPAQDCAKNYGGALTIQNIIMEGPKIVIRNLHTIKPQSYKYSLGTHTLNSKDGVCVVDGYGYLYPLAGHVFEWFHRSR